MSRKIDLKEEEICTDWPKEHQDTPTYSHECIKRMHLEDIIFLKIFDIKSQTLNIYAIGMVNDKYREDGTEGCIGVKWLWLTENPEKISDLRDGFVCRNTTIYEEINPRVINKIITILSAKRGTIQQQPYK